MQKFNNKCTYIYKDSFDRNTSFIQLNATLE